MKYVVDNDLHIHSRLSLCSHDPEQTPEAILKYAEDNNLKTVCITDHYWDDEVEGGTVWYRKQNFDHISESKPLPKSDKVRFLFGCECELDRHLKLSIPKSRFDEFDFIVVPTTHFHMHEFTITLEQNKTPESRAKTWAEHLDAVLNMDLPFHKIGFAHLTCTLIDEHIKTIAALDEKEMYRLFKKVKEKGAGIELNTSDLRRCAKENEDIIYRPYKIAKECGCKFYHGSDAHARKEFEGAVKTFEYAAEIIGLTEDDKFII